jgi:hypothetical protein
VGNPFGASYAGLSTWFSDAGNDIHGYNGTSGGAGGWAVDGRTADPRFVVSGDPRTTSLANFRGQGVEGTWDLFFADLNSGGEAHLNGWSLEFQTDLQAVPEPGTGFMSVVFVFSFAGVRLGRSLWDRFRRNPP